MNLNLKSIFSFSVLFFFMQSLSASDNGANQWRNNQNVWQDQTINGINRLPSRQYYLFFPESGLGFGWRQREIGVYVVERPMEV